MNKLELLWKLEEHNINLDDFMKKISELNKDADEENNDIQVKRLNRRSEILDNNIGIIKTAILQYEDTLSKYEVEVESLDDKLYKDNITDIKQLEYLGFEKEQLQKKISEVEKEMMAYMEEDEILEKRHTDNISTLKELEEKIGKQFSTGTKELNRLEEELKAEKQNIEAITQKLDMDSLKEYNGLRDRKDKPIVIVKNDMCSGCYMKIPIYQLEGLRRQIEIINCESCGRILFLKD